MIAAWIVYGLVTGALVAVAACGAEGVLRLSGRPGRWAWAGGMLLALALVVGVPLRSAPAPASAAVAVLSALPAGGERTAAEVGRVDRLLQEVGRRGTAAAAALREGAGRVPEGAQRALGVGWGVATGALLLLLAATHLRLRRARRGWIAAEVAGEPVLVSPGTGPAVVGWVRPRIVVPGWLLGLRAEEQRLVLEHEREHLRARDPLLLGVGCVAAALLPWHPAAWWMLSRLRLAVELDCDARVLRRGAPAASYGTLLIDLAGRCSGLRVGAPALADSPTHLRRRLVAMTPQPVRYPLARAGALSALAMLALAAACEARLPTTAEVAAMDVADAEAATRALIGADPGSIYVVDGVEVTAEQARALAPEQIDHIAVHRPDRAGVPSRFEILTHPAAPAPPPTPLAEPDPTAPPAPPANPPAIRRGSEGDLRLPGRTEVRRGARVSGPDFDGIILLDGVQVSAAELNALSRERIASMEVIKGDAALRLSSDPAARHGIIRVTTHRE